MGYKDYRDLIVWQKATQFSIKIYTVTKVFPKDEVYGLTNQIRRASVSIASNIAEGAARKSKLEFKQFLHIALGSLAELKTQLFIANGIGYLDSDSYKSLENDTDELGKLLHKLKQSIT